MEINWIHKGRSLELRSGPTHAVVSCSGTPEAMHRAYQKLVDRFVEIIPELVSELNWLRTELPYDVAELNGKIARAMYTACEPYQCERITPMSAVAGAISEHLLQLMSSEQGIGKAWVNNGGDIALYLTGDERFDCGIHEILHRSEHDATFRLTARDGIGGVATSGRVCNGQGGRSFSLGIADAVTVLAKTAAMADAAATMIANKVDLPGHPAVARVPADQIEPDTDLCSRPVVVGVSMLTRRETEQALSNGIEYAHDCMQRGLIVGARLCLNGQTQIIGNANPLLLAA